MAHTRGFVNAAELRRHHSAHGSDFGALDAAGYEAMADSFWANPISAGVHECKRKRGDIIRFDPATGAFGVMDQGGVIRTYFKAVPCADVPSHLRESLRLAGRCHRHGTNLDYFESECRKW